jgi:hypothetical protein
MKITSGVISVVALLAVAGVVAAVAPDVRADDAGSDDSGCKRAKGTYSAVFTTTNCTAPSGLCSVGTITDGGPLNGTTSFFELDQAPSAGMPLTEPGTTVSYSGQLTITTKKGTLTIHDLGVTGGPTSSFTEIEEPLSGTGIFAGTTNNFFISGVLTNDGTTFNGTVSGEICTQ